MAIEKKKKIGTRAASILSETSDDAEASSQIMAQIDVGHDAKDSKPAVEEKIEKQATKRPEMMMGMWKNMPALNSSNKAMEPLMELTKVQQQSFMNMYQVWSDQLGKIGEASRSAELVNENETPPATI